MALDASGIERACQAVTQGSEREMLEALADAIVEHLKAGTAGEWDEQALLALAEEWPARADEIMAGYAPKVADEVKAGVRQALIGSSLAEVAAAGTAYLAMRKDGSMAGTDAYTAAERVYRRSQDEGITAKLQRKAEQRADEAAQRAAKAVQRLNLQMEQASAEAYRQAMRDAVTQWVGNERTRAAIVEGAVQRLGDAFQVEYASGAKTTVDVAINRALTTELSQTDGDNSLAAMRGLGCQLGITDAHYGARPSHAVWQGRPFGIDGEVTADGVTYPAMTALTGYGSATGLKGINCRHSISPYWPGITELPDTEFKADRAMHNGMGSDEYYAATQRQRAYERAVRKSKARIAQMERAGIGLESPAYVQERLKLGNQQRNLRSLCSANNMKRQPARERAYGVSSQPRALTAKPTQKYKTLTQARDKETLAELRGVQRLDRKRINALQKAGDKAMSDMTEDELEAIDGYTTGDHNKVNQYLYKSKKQTKNQREGAAEEAALLDKAIGRFSLNEDVLTFSGTSAAHYKDWEVGETRKLDGFVSSSVRLKDAKEFAQRERVNGKEPLVIEIQVPKGTPCLFIGENTSFPRYQGEFLLEHGLEYLVKEKKDGKMLVEVVLQ